MFSTVLRDRLLKGAIKSARTTRPQMTPPTMGPMMADLRVLKELDDLPWTAVDNKKPEVSKQASLSHNVI